MEKKSKASVLLTEEQGTEAEALINKDGADSVNKRSTGKGKQKIKTGESFKNILNKLLSLSPPADKLNDSLKSSPLGEKITYGEAILLAQIIKATNGDTQAAVFLRDTSGNKLKERDKEEGKHEKFENL